jgi:hypothetical protein
MKQKPLDQDFKKTNLDWGFGTNPKDTALICTPKRGHDFGLEAMRLRNAACFLFESLWRIFTIWLLVPAAGALCFMLLQFVGFPYPGLGVLIGTMVARQRLPDGIVSVFRPSSIGLYFYLAIVFLGHAMEIILSGSIFERLLDITLLGGGAPITKYHWLGWVALGFAHLACLRRGGGSGGPKQPGQGRSLLLGLTNFARALLSLAGASLAYALIGARSIMSRAFEPRRRRQRHVAGVGIIVDKEEQLTIVLDEENSVPIEKERPPL